MVMKRDAVHRAFDVAVHVAGSEQERRSSLEGARDTCERLALSVTGQVEYYAPGDCGIESAASERQVLQFTADGVCSGPFAAESSEHFTRAIKAHDAVAGLHERARDGNSVAASRV